MDSLSEFLREYVYATLEERKMHVLWIRRSGVKLLVFSILKDTNGKEIVCMRLTERM